VVLDIRMAFGIPTELAIENSCYKKWYVFKTNPKSWTFVAQKIDILLVDPQQKR
jgi:hypothetical protein